MKSTMANHDFFHSSGSLDTLGLRCQQILAHLHRKGQALSIAFLGEVLYKMHLVKRYFSILPKQHLTGL